MPRIQVVCTRRLETNCLLKNTLQSPVFVGNYWVQPLPSMSARNQSSPGEPRDLSLDEFRRLSDESLMTHLQAGHVDVLAVIFERYYRLVLSVAMKILRDVGEAEDLMQTVFLEIFKSAAQFDPGRGTLKVWILQYAYHRGMSRRQHLTLRKFYKSTDIAEVHGELLTTDVMNFNDMEIRQLVTEALGNLNETQSKILKLAYFEGLSLREIAERTNENLGNVRHHYYRGLNRLRAVIRNEPGTGKLRLKKQEQADASA